ncbi:DUF4259 domain-containing protein [Kitasatospora sp. NPDC096147]|uniref:DUF4259 domain-containing protein n=1 Tax=Kitasatospora sp. NPDC096147 TaxID=3364093 RepID=UPI00381A6E4B
MGTWDIGPFDNDTAADFADDLDEAPAAERVAMVRTALVRAADTPAAPVELDAPVGMVAVAAAALVAARCPGGPPLDTVYAPDEPFPALTPDLRPLAVGALDRVVAEGSELAELWDEEADGRAWRQDVRRLRALLEPEPEPLCLEQTLFDL